MGKGKGDNVSMDGREVRRGKKKDRVGEGERSLRLFMRRPLQDSSSTWYPEILASFTAEHNTMVSISTRSQYMVVAGMFF